MADVPITISLETIAGDSGAKIAGIAKALNEVFTQIRELAKEGDAAQDVFNNLKISLEAAQAATGGEVARLELAEKANKAYLGGLRLTSNEYARIAEFAKKAADATGEEFGSVMDRVIEGMVTGRTRGLKPFIGDLEVTGTQAEKAAQILDALTRSSGNLTAGTDTAGDAAARFETKLSDMRTEMLQGFTASESLTKAFDDMTMALGQGEGAAHGLGWAIGELAGWALRTVPAMQSLVAVATTFARLKSYITAATEGNLSAGEGEAPDRNVLGHPMTMAGVSGRAPNARPPQRRRRQGGGGGGGGRRDVGPDTSMEVGTFLFGPGSTVEPEPAEDLEPKQLANQWADAVDDVRGSVKGYMAALDAVQKKDDWFTERARNNAEKRRRERMAEMDMASSWAASLGSTFSAVGGALGASESTQNLIRGTTETVLAAIAWAKAVAPGGQAFIPEAVAHTAAAAMAFAAAANPSGGSTGSTGGGGVPSGAGPSFVGGGGGASGGGRTTNITINMGPGVSSARDVRREIQRALIMEADNGNPMPYRVVSSRR